LNHKLFFLIWMACSVLIAGCAKTVKEVRLLDHSAQRQLYALQTWRLEGRIAVQVKDKAWHASLFWDHRPTQDRLQVTGPFNQGAMTIVVQDKLIYVQQADGTIESSPEPDQLLESRLGFAVPLSALRYWVLGLPEPTRAHQPSFDRAGVLRSLTQLGWLVQFEQFMRVNNTVVPRKAVITSPNVRIKLIADEWVLAQRHEETA
jgi:outer membrane lipoprotein LolB